MTGPPPLLQDDGDPGRRGASSVEHLAPPETHRDAARNGRVEIALEVAMPLCGGVVEQPAVELHLDVMVGVGRVGVPHPIPG